MELPNVTSDEYYVMIFIGNFGYPVKKIYKKRIHQLPAGQLWDNRRVQVAENREM